MSGADPEVVYEYEGDVNIPVTGAETDLLPAYLDVSGATDIVLTIENTGGLDITSRVRRTASVRDPTLSRPAEVPSMTAPLVAGAGREVELTRNSARWLMPTAQTKVGDATVVHIAVRAVSIASP